MTKNIDPAQRTAPGKEETVTAYLLRKLSRKDTKVAETVKPTPVQEAETVSSESEDMSLTELMIITVIVGLVGFGIAGGLFMLFHI
jgi:hypothetical protein